MDSKNDYCNVAKVGGAGEEMARVFTTVGNATGLNRYEMFVDDAGTQKEDGQTDTDYLAALTQDGNEALAEHLIISSLDANVAASEDIQLGDKVTVMDKELGLKMNTFVSAIQDIYEGTDHSRNITFGYDVPTIYTKMKG